MCGKQGVAEKLLARMLRSGGERWEAKLALLQVTSRIVGTHRLLLLGLYPLLQKYLHPHQRDAPAILAVLVQVSSCRAGESEAACLLRWLFVSKLRHKLQCCT